MYNQTENDKRSSTRFSKLIKNLRPLLIILGVIGLCPLTVLVYYHISSSTFDPLRGPLGSYRNYIEIEGSIIDGIYTPPLKNFSCRFPSLKTAPMGKVLQDHFWTDGSGAVIFTDDFGTLLRVDYWEVNESVSLSFENPDKKKASFENELSNLIKDSFLPSKPNTSVSHKEFLDSENGVILYGVIDTGESYNGLVGVFYLGKDKFVYRLMNNSGSMVDLKQGLLDFYHTCEFK